MSVEHDQSTRTALSNEILLCPKLSPGDQVCLISPSSFPTQDWVDESVQILESWGLQVKVGNHALDKWGYMAGRDEDRLSDLNDAFRNPEVRAIITTRGGAGAYRIADGIDFDAVRSDPKPLVGFSDTSNLHLALWEHCRLPGIHGCLAGQEAQASVRHLLMTTETLTVKRDPTVLSAAIEVSGQATGPLIGGNLSAITGTIGAGLPSLDGDILFIEDLRKVGLGQVDRQLTQLMRSGSLDGLQAIALGLFDGFEDYTDRGWNLLDVLGDRLLALGVPIVGGLKLGHGGLAPDDTPDQYAVTLGPSATLDATTGTLTVGSCVH